MTSGEVVDNARFIHRTDSASFHCVDCGMAIITRLRSIAVVAMKTICLQCGAKSRYPFVKKLLKGHLLRMGNNSVAK